MFHLEVTLNQLPLFTAILKGYVEMIQFFVEMCETYSSLQSLIDYQFSKYIEHDSNHYHIKKLNLQKMKID
jgi:hypothetical protein